MPRSTVALTLVVLLAVGSTGCRLVTLVSESGDGSGSTGGDSTGGGSTGGDDSDSDEEESDDSDSDDSDGWDDEDDD